MASDASSDQLSHIPDTDASSFRKITDTTRLRALQRDEHQCWLCGLAFDDSALQVAHNVSAATTVYLMKMWKDMGILPVDFFPGNLNNVISICLLCHQYYELDHPGWVLLPEDMNKFIEFEIQDYIEREEAAKRGVGQRRTLPPVNPAGELCRPYIIGREFVKTLDWTRFPKVYAGWPQTLILRAKGGCFTPSQRVKIGENGSRSVYTGVPDEVMEAVTRLVSLWSRSDPEVPSEKGVKKKRKRGKTKASDDESDDDGLRKGRRSGKALGKSQKQVQGDVKATGKPRTQKGHSGSRRGNTKQETPAMHGWAIGPEKTSSDLISETIMWQVGRGGSLGE